MTDPQPSFQKRPGLDWRVSYRWLDEEEAETMVVFGAADEASAMKDARHSLDAAEVAYEVLSIAVC